MDGEDKIPSGFQDISYETTIKSSASEEALKQLVETVENQCPMLDMLERSVKVSGNVTFI